MMTKIWLAFSCYDLRPYICTLLERVSTLKTLNLANRKTEPANICAALHNVKDVPMKISCQRDLVLKILGCVVAKRDEYVCKCQDLPRGYNP